MLYHCYNITIYTSDVHICCKYFMFWLQEQVAALQTELNKLKENLEVNSATIRFHACFHT